MEFEGHLVGGIKKAVIFYVFFILLANVNFFLISCNNGECDRDKLIFANPVGYFKNLFSDFNSVALFFVLLIVFMMVGAGLGIVYELYKRNQRNKYRSKISALIEVLDK